MNSEPAIETPLQRYLRDAEFHAVVDFLVAMHRHRGWSFATMHDAWILARTISDQQKLRDLTK